MPIEAIAWMIGYVVSVIMTLTLLYTTQIMKGVFPDSRTMRKAFTAFALLMSPISVVLFTAQFLIVAIYAIGVLAWLISTSLARHTKRMLDAIWA